VADFGLAKLLEGGSGLHGYAGRTRAESHLEAKRLPRALATV
jgi:hypothetical protein